jgi:hypothetical protein
VLLLFASGTRNADGTRALSQAELAPLLVEIADSGDNGKPKTGRRFYYLALSRGYIQPIMDDTKEGKASRDAAYGRITEVLGKLRKLNKLAWTAVLDLTRDLDQWQTYTSAREARARLRLVYDEDRWLGQPYYPVFIVEKDTMEPICRPMAMRWQMPFASSRGYSSLKLQHDVAAMLRQRFAKTGQWAVIYFISDHDPSGFDLQRAWEQAMADFSAHVFEFVRVGLTRDQVNRLPDEDATLRQGIEIKLDFLVTALPQLSIEPFVDVKIQCLLDGFFWQDVGLPAAVAITLNIALGAAISGLKARALL